MNKAVIKWAGGKLRNLNHILPHLPEGERLVEPFSGGAVACLNSDYEQYWINDICEDLVNLYLHIIGYKSMFIDVAKTYFTPLNNTAGKYLEERELFNANRAKNLVRACRFLYLNKHGYNGLCRYNQKGGYNAPFGRNKKPYFPKKEMEIFIKKFSQKALITHYSFETVLKELRSGDVVYCDPPFIPLSNTANFTSYDKYGFNLEKHILLAETAKQSPNFVAISNHDTEFIRNLYKDASEIHSYYSSRFISCQGNNRQPVKELLAIYR